MSLHSQSVVKAEEAATQQATKMVELKPGHSYLWSTGSDDSNPLIEYIESCNPAKQYSTTSKIVNGTAEVEDGNVSMKSEDCSKTYDSRQKSVNEQAGDPWGLKTRHAQAEAKKKVDEAREAAESRKRKAEKAQAESQRQSAAIAKGCSGLYPGKKVERTVMGGWGLSIYTIEGLDSASKQVTLRDTYDGHLTNSSCFSVQMMK